MKIIFIHGSGAWGGIWHKQLDCFADAEAITLPGHPEGIPRTSVSEYAEWLYGYVKGRGYKNVVLAGHSLGGAIVMHYAVKYPQSVSALVLAATGARLRALPLYVMEIEDAVKGHPEDWQKRLREHMSRLPSPEAEALLKRIVEIGPRAHLNDTYCGNGFDLMKEVRKIAAPTLVLCGEKDTLTPVKYADYLADRIPGAKKVIIKAAGHLLMLEKPAEFNRAIEEFLAPSPPRPQSSPSPGSRSR